MRDESGYGGHAAYIVFSGGTSAQEYREEGSAAGFDSADTLEVEYIRGSDYGGGVGGILYTLRDRNFSAKHYNSRGDVVASTDSEGTLTYQAAYEAFGKHGDTASSQEWGTNPDRQQANTKDEDPTGLLNEGFRYRDLEIGTFITRDPLGFVDGPNLYTYVVQNPWTHFDPLGLFFGKQFREDPRYAQALSDNLAGADQVFNNEIGNRWAGASDSLMMNAGSMLSGPNEITDSAEFKQAQSVSEKVEMAAGLPAIIKTGGKLLIKEGAEVVVEKTVKETTEVAVETSAKKTATKNGADFVVTPDGTAVPVSQSQMREGFEKAGFPSKPTESAGTAYTMPDGNQVRLMEPSGQAPRRASFTGPSPHDTAKTPDFKAPSQPPAGSTKAERKQHIRDETHVEQRE